MEKWAVWVMGLPGSGKTTVSKTLRKKLEAHGVKCRIIGIDQIRKKWKLFDYSPEGREKAYSLLVKTAAEQVNKGENIIIDATAHLRKFREAAREKIPRFFEVYLKCPLKICIEREFGRDRKKAYRIYGQKKWVPGLHVEYEEPKNPEILIETDKKSPEEAAKVIFSRLKSKKWT